VNFCIQCDYLVYEPKNSSSTLVATCSASSCTTALARVEILTRDQSVVGHHRRAHRKLRNHGLRELGSKTWERFLRLTRNNCFGHRQPTKREFAVRVAELSGANPSPEPPGRGHWALCRPPLGRRAGHSASLDL
jgi:hypothetical protein